MAIINGDRRPVDALRTQDPLGRWKIPSPRPTRSPRDQLVDACGGHTKFAEPPPEIVHQWAEAFLDGNPDTVAALFTEDATYRERGSSQVFEGRIAIRQQLDRAFLYAEATEMTPKTIITGDGVIGGSKDVITVDGP